MGLAVPPEAGLDANLGLDALAEVFQDPDHGLGGEVLVKVVSDLDHGGVDAGAEALDLGEGEEPVGSGLPGVDAQVGLDGHEDGLAVAQHARRRGAQLQMVLAHRLSVEHRVKRARLINFRLCNIQDLCNLKEKRKERKEKKENVRRKEREKAASFFFKNTNLVHCSKRNPSTTLTLSQIKERNGGSLGVSRRVLGYDLLHQSIVFLGKVKGGLLIVVSRMLVLVRSHITSSGDSSPVHATDAQREEPRTRQSQGSQHLVLSKPLFFSQLLFRSFFFGAKTRRKYIFEPQQLPLYSSNFEKPFLLLLPCSV